MSAITADQTQIEGTADAACGLTVNIYDSLEPAEIAWRAIEADGVITPYQRYDWIKALLASGMEAQGRLAIVVVNSNGKPGAVLPLIIERRFGMQVGRLIGSDISNSDWLAASWDFSPSPQQLAHIWVEIGKAVPLDIIAFFNMPQSWQGVANPILALGSDPAPNNTYFATIGPTPIPYIDHRMTNKKRSNIRRGTRRLEETMGPVVLKRVNDVSELEKVHAAFISQRGERFDQMGIGNIFAQEHFVKFFKTLAMESFGSERPPLVFHALYAGEDIVATACGAYSGTHYSQYINSTCNGPAAKYSLSGVLLANLMDELTTSGVLTFDMGIGDFDYKTDWTEPMPLFNNLIPISPKGQVAAMVLRARQGLKRAIKQNKQFWKLAQAARLALYKARKH